LFLPCLVAAQEVKPQFDFSKTDSIAMSVKFKGDIYELTKELTNPFPERIFKARAIFRWITDNIAYDYKFFNKYYYKGREPKGFSCEGDSMECDVKKKVWEIEYVNNVLDKKRAVCQGYSMLFKKMCDIAGIESEVVPGYIRTQYYEVGSPGELIHAWNSVKINSDYYLLDATWAAGGCAKDEDGKLLSFKKDYDDYYWLTPAEEFARNHYPEDAKWVLLPKYTIEKFSSNPYYASDEIENIKVITPYTGTIAAKRGDTIHFKLRYSDSLHHLQINTNIFRNPDIWYWEYITKHKRMKMLDTFAVKKQQYVKYKRDNDIYQFDYIVKDHTLEYLDIIFDTKRVMRFKVNVKG
jgi:hypothetical protein